MSGPLNAGTIPAAFQQVVALRPDDVALRTIDDSFRLTWAELGQRVRELAAGLSTLGLGLGDTAAIVLPNTPECHLIDYTVSHLGGVPFAIFNSSPAEQIEHQLRNSGCRIVFTAESFRSRVETAVAALDGQVEHLIVIDAEDGKTSIETLCALGDPAFDFDDTWQAVAPSDLATLIYTSGTTGPPKGAEWTHNTVMAEQRALDAVLPMPTEALISFLPMAHAGGRITAQYMALAYGAAITACPDMGKLPAHIGQVHPDAFFSVPRLWEKLQVAIEALIDALPGPVRASAQRALEVGYRRVTAEEGGSGASAAEVATLVAEHNASLAVLEPVLARIGLDRLKAAYVGGAPSAPELTRFFRAAGVPLLEAYGLTEGSLNVFNRVDDFKTGTSGKPLPGVELKLAEDGELLCRAQLNFAGYRRQPEETAAALDSDGWLHTGDIAEIDECGYVSIVDRKKEIIINAAGKNMSPVTIESAIKGSNSLIGQVVAIGDRRRFVSALITLDPEATAIFVKRSGLEGVPIDDLVRRKELRGEIEDAVARGNARLHSNEQVKKFVVLPAAWQPDSDELTPTAKLKRRTIHEKYAEHIEQLYAD